MMLALFLSFLISLGCCFIVLKIFSFFNLVDVPDGVRKTHKGKVTFGGGVALFLSVSAVFFLFSEQNGVIDFLFFKELFIIWYVSIILLVLGFIDDIKPLPVSLRLIVQILASWLVIILSDVYLVELGDLLGLGNIYLGELGIPLTIFMVVGMCNAFNMLDGMDGLVTLIAIVAFLAIGVLAFFVIKSSIFLFAVACFMGFLFFNLGLFGKKWKMFLGDSGSMWLGFIVAWFLVFLSQGDTKTLNPVTALWLVLLPLIDALSTFLTRIWKGKAIFKADRSHIHHMLLDTGLVKWKVLVIFIGVSVISAGFGIYALISSIKDYYLFYGFLTLWFFYILLVKYPYQKNINS